jgi:hypothetical protein
MLKCIRVESLKLGMWVEELRGSWQEHPFWRDSFLLADPKDLERILESSIREVWIDTNKGLDAPAGTEIETVEEVAAAAQRELDAADSPPPGVPRPFPSRRNCLKRPGSANSPSRQ